MQRVNHLILLADRGLEGEVKSDLVRMKLIKQLVTTVYRDEV